MSRPVSDATGQLKVCSQVYTSNKFQKRHPYIVELFSRSLVINGIDAATVTIQLIKLDPIEYTQYAMLQNHNNHSITYMSSSSSS